MGSSPSTLRAPLPNLATTEGKARPEKKAPVKGPQIATRPFSSRPRPPSSGEHGKKSENLAPEGWSSTSAVAIDPSETRLTFSPEVLADLRDMTCVNILASLPSNQDGTQSHDVGFERGQRGVVKDAIMTEVAQSDGYRWRKYGQKIVKGSAHPRAYYKCSTKDCKARKVVERVDGNEVQLHTTYKGQHNHVPGLRAQPTARDASKASYTTSSYSGPHPETDVQYQMVAMAPPTVPSPAPTLTVASAASLPPPASSDLSPPPPAGVLPPPPPPPMSHILPVGMGSAAASGLSALPPATAPPPPAEAHAPAAPVGLVAPPMLSTGMMGGVDEPPAKKARYAPPEGHAM